MRELISDQLARIVAAGEIDQKFPRMTPQQRAMLMLWYGSSRQVTAAAGLIAGELAGRPDVPADVPTAWLVDGVLFATGHRALMRSIPAVAADMLLSINGGTHAFRAMWVVGEVLRREIAEPTWRHVRDALAARA